ncbi:hypothetical protein [Myxococcus qinghaiensis]|uniref:hypothetical protein n=1 Tax=Myxococcus qinghaiensis TaxID=2906758 RepID=UPI0020A7B134|nr:hypothetical protein [Myxococcus qinghaiensis]MCP3169937.1 hypothetical protein [Myxococcus qinghaiensis]
MTDEKKFKARVRARMERTGERFMTAKRNLEAEDAARGAGAATHPHGGAPLAHQERRRSFREESLTAWRAMTEGFSGKSAGITWTDVRDIVGVLEGIGKKAPLNHVFLPSRGGLDLEGASHSQEADCIELSFDGITRIVRPDSLQFVMPERDPLREWAYFLLQTGKLAPSGVYESGPNEADEAFEVVLELTPGEYVESFYWDEGDYGVDEAGEPQKLPDGARLINRCFGGSFLIVAKASRYNLWDGFDADRAAHAKQSPAEFQALIQGFVDELHKGNLYGSDPS